MDTVTIQTNNTIFIKSLEYMAMTANVNFKVDKGVATLYGVLQEKITDFIDDYILSKKVKKALESKEKPHKGNSLRACLIRVKE